MPKEKDSERLNLLARLLLGAIGTVQFDWRAFKGHPAERDDCGLNGLLGTELPIVERQRMLREALADFLRTGGVPNCVEVSGDEGMQLDPETRYEFRFSFAGVDVYVKTVLSRDDPQEPELMVKKVARQNRA